MNPALPDRAAELSRRSLIRNTGLSALAIGALSACSNYGSQPAAPPTEAPASGGAESGSPGSAGGGGNGGLTATKAEIPVGGGKIFADAQAVVTQPTSGDFKAFTAVCTHQTCIVATVTETINCDCHGSKFSITDGSVITGPAPSPLAAKQVAADGDDLTIT
jgi:Rieske Fe-S protein